MGEAAFELVAVYREEDWGDAEFRRDFPIVTVTCYFKRPVAPNTQLPQKPLIGFRPRGD